MKRSVTVSLFLVLALLSGCQTGAIIPTASRTAKTSVRPAPSSPNSAALPNSSPSPVVSTAPIARSSSLSGVVRLDAHYLVSAGGGQLRGTLDTPVVDALAALRRTPGLVGNDAASLVGHDSASLVGNDAASVIARDGVTLLGQDGASVIGASEYQGRLIANGGGNLIANGGGNLVANGGGNLVASGGGNFKGAFGLLSRPWLKGSYHLHDVRSVAPGTVVPAAGMVVQLIDLRSGLPVVMVDSKGRAGDAVLTDASGRYQVYLPESVKNNVMVRVHAPGQLADARLRYARVTAPGASQPDVQDDVSAVAQYFRGALAARLLYFFSRDVSGASRWDNPAEQMVANGLAPTLEALGKVRVDRWSKSDQYLLARRMADRVLARVKNWENLPLMVAEKGGSDEEFTARFIVALLTKQALPQTEQSALKEMASVMGSLMELAKFRMGAGYDFAANPVIRIVNRYAAEWQGQKFGAVAPENRPAWLRAGGFAIKAPADLCDFFAQSIVLSDKDRELDKFLTARRTPPDRASVVEALVGLGIDEQQARAWWDTRSAEYYAEHPGTVEYFAGLGLTGVYLDGDGPSHHFVRLLRSLGESKATADDKVERLRLAAASIMAVLTVELIGGPDNADTAVLQKEFVEDITYYATPEGRSALRELSSLK